MDLPVMPPVAPMLAVASSTLPIGPEFVYEPKWDGFRSIVFRDSQEVELASRSERPLTRYFPEVIEVVEQLAAEKLVIDGEIVIAGDTGLDFDALLERIHPAPSRIRALAASTPATLVAFDLLALGEQDLRAESFSTRRRLLEAALGGERSIVVSPSTTDAALATEWFSRFEGAGFDGIVAKDAGLPYRAGERVMVKVKHHRTADCVVGGFRTHKDGIGVGSLLLGLYDDAGVLQHVGVASSFTAARRRELLAEVAPFRLTADEGHPWLGEDSGAQRRPGAQSRWSAGKDLSFEPLRPELVCEVAYDHLQGDRFRHATQFVRWRSDRVARSCTYRQLEVVAPAELAAIFGR